MHLNRLVIMRNANDSIPELIRFSLGQSRKKHWIVVCFTAFILFLWGSGLRIMSRYPDRQWKWGLIGVFAFFSWILAGRFRTASRYSVPDV
jgi:hypothetical protein